MMMRMRIMAIMMSMMMMRMRMRMKMNKMRMRTMRMRSITRRSLCVCLPWAIITQKSVQTGVIRINVRTLVTCCTTGSPDNITVR